MKDFIKQNLGRVIIWILMLSWLTFIFCLWFFPSLEKPKTLNELGDFIAGAFAPLAFLFLYLGYKQQGESLRESNEMILEQLKQQGESLELQKLEQIAKENSLQPIFENTASIILPKEMSDFDINNYQIEIRIKNMGETITSVQVDSGGQFAQTLSFRPFLKYEDEIIRRLIINKETIINDDNNEYVPLPIYIGYTTLTGLKYKCFFIINISTSSVGLFYEMESKIERVL